MATTVKLTLAPAKTVWPAGCVVIAGATITGLTVSIAAELVSELADTEIYHLWVTRVTRRLQWLRVLSSNAVSVPLDTLIFCWGAFGGVLPSATVWSIVAANLILKGLVSVASLPTIYLVREKGTGAEQ